jgi:uncharacterized protein (DUF924 family)
VDADIVSRFKPDCEALLRGDYDAWQRQPLEALAGIIIGDQLARNVYRGTARMYAADPKALAWSKSLLVSLGEPAGARRRLLGGWICGAASCRWRCLPPHWAVLQPP